LKLKAQVEALEQQLKNLDVSFFQFFVSVFSIFFLSFPNSFLFVGVTKQSFFAYYAQFRIKTLWCGQQLRESFVDFVFKCLAQALFQR